MRFPLVILAFLTTVLGSNLEELTNAPTLSLSTVTNDLDSTREGSNEEVETETFKDADEGKDQNKDGEAEVDEGDQSGSEAGGNKISGDEVNEGKVDDTTSEGSNEEVETETFEYADEGKDQNKDGDAEVDEGGESGNEAGGNQISGDEVNEGKVEDNEEDKNQGVNANEEKDKESLSVREEDKELSNESFGTEGNNGDDERAPNDEEEDEDTTIASSRTINPGLNDLAPSPTPYPTTYKSPTLRPAVPYVSTDDDPLEKGDDFVSNIKDWFSNESTIEEMEHDKSVIIALSILFGIMFFFSIYVAYQMLENPDGCCASLCRITVACWCAVIQCICYPCRSMCGSNGPSGGQHMMVPDDGHFTHDLELS